MLRLVSNKIGIAAILVLTHLAIPASGQESRTVLEGFWTIQDFNSSMPDEWPIFSSFAKRVDSPATDQISNEKPVRITVVYPGLQASDYWRRSVTSFEARLKELGVSYEIESQFTKPGTELHKQMKLISDSVKTDPDYLVFTLDAVRHKAIIERLIARGKPKLILQNITTPIQSWGTRQPFLYVGFDHLLGTNKLIEHYQNAYPQDAKYAIFYGPRGYVSRARGDTFRAGFASAGQDRLAAAYYVGFDREKSRETALTLLREQPDIRFIYSCSTDIALGVIDAIDELGLQGKVSTNGWGGGSAELEAIQAGKLDVTVMRINDHNGVAMADAIALDVSGAGNRVPQIYSGPFEIVTAKDSAEKIEELKKRAFRYSQ